MIESVIYTKRCTAWLVLIGQLRYAERARDRVALDKARILDVATVY